MKKILGLLVFATVMFFSSCGGNPVVEPCGGACPEGYDCVNGQCESTNNETVIKSGIISTDETWTADKYYELIGKVVVDGGATLTIEPGTIIKGREGTGSLASALVIARGSKIQACGTADAPIIFTSVLDNIKIGELAGTNLDETDNEKWGGLILLGAAPVSTKDGDTEGQIEGIPADEPYGVYGGDDPMDNSGSLCYVSVRHGGALIGEGNEINGITLGGVGAGTTINHVEVVANLDDGIEFFGGTVNLDHVIITYQDDDGLDIDQNYSGTINNFFVIHGGDGTDEGLEIDGPEGSTYVDGKFTLQNGTIISADGNGSGADLKSKAQGFIQNVYWSGYSTLVKVKASFDADNACADKTDAYTHLISGDLDIKNSEVVGTITMADFLNAYTKSEGCEASLTDTYQMNADAAIDNQGNAVVSEHTSLTGADISEMTGWSWTDAKGLLQ